MKKNYRLEHAFRILLAGFFFTLMAPESPMGAIRKADNVSLENVVNASKVAVATLDQIGHPISDADRKLLEEAWKQTDENAVGHIQDIMDRYAWFDVRVNEEAWLKAETASSDLASRPLVQGAWTPFLVKVRNESASDAPLGIRSRQALADEELESAEKGKLTSSDEHSWYRWLGIKIYPDAKPYKSAHGTKIRYLVVGMFSRDAGLRHAELEFHLRGGPVTEGHFISTRVLFDVKPQTEG